MGSKVQGVLARIQAVLRDANNDSWPEGLIYLAILEAERVIVTYRQDATATDVEFSCALGSRQSIAALSPAPFRFLAAKYNRAGGVDGRSVRRIGIGDIDAISPNWRSKTPAAEIREFLFDEREPLTFYTNPPAATGAKLQISYSAEPVDFTASAINAGTATTVSSIYDPMIMEWALYRLFGHDVENSVNVGRSQQHLGNFQNMMGVKVQSDAQFSPKNDEYRK